jgi:hypothetical protein
VRWSWVIFAMTLFVYLPPTCGSAAVRSLRSGGNGAGQGWSPVGRFAAKFSITFMKDIGHIPASLPWLFAASGSFLVASLCAFISLLTSGETDRERRKQLDCSVWEGECDELPKRRRSRVNSTRT